MTSIQLLLLQKYVYTYDIIEAHCYVVITSESMLMSKYVAESINQTTECRMSAVLYEVDKGLRG